MAPAWQEVQQAQDEKRCELVLSGPHISKRISEDGLDTSIFKIKHLNFLEISKTTLECVPDDIGDLTCLTRIVLRGNNLQSIPTSIGNLGKLKFLDVSFNALPELPAEVGKLSELQSLNVSNNKLSALPDLSALLSLVSLNISFNSFTEFPSGICLNQLTHLSELVANNNAISCVPPEVNQLVALKVLNLSENSLTALPGELGDCNKLKELNLKGNKLKDKRLVKLIDQCHTKQVLEYVRSHCPKRNAEDTKQAKSKKKAKQNKKSSGNDEIMQQQLDQIKVLHVQDETVKIVSTPNVQDIRPYVVSCIIRDFNFESNQSLKKFISLQTKLHESVCEKRTIATIATHDLSKIKGNLLYDAREPNAFKILPLNRKKEVTASELYMQLNEEADAVRKEKKKNTYSGIHKYLYLLKDKPLYPCLIDESGQVISFPPITNSDVTKVSEETKNILVEVTGNSLPQCKKIMDTLLEEIVKLALSKQDTGSDDEDEGTSPSRLEVEQVKIVDEEGKLKVVYPSRTDLQFDKINVIRT